MVLQRKVSLEEFLTRPETKPYQEYINGEVRTKALPNLAHSLTQLELGFFLRLWDADALVVTEQRCLFTSNAVLPDVAVFPAGSTAFNAKGQAVAAPMLAVKILSPDDTYSDVQEKVNLYLEAGTPLVWVIDPSNRKVTVHHVTGRPTVISGDRPLEDPLLPGFSLSLADLFRKLDTLLPPEQP